MVTLEVMRESNARIGTSLPAGLVAVFVGATSGIGETTLRQFSKQARNPRVYFLGRRETEGRRIEAELKEINPDGEFYYVQADVSLLKNVDQACRSIRQRESKVNLLFLSSGTLISGKQTAEGLNYATALTYYARTRFILNLLPLLRTASSLRRVVTVGAAGKEGPVDTSDFPANHLGMLTFRGHLTSMITLSLATIATRVPGADEVSFVHDYPGFVKTGLSRELKGFGPAVMKVLFAPVMALLQIPIEETGERQLYLATSARFPPYRHGENGDGDGVRVPVAGVRPPVTEEDAKVGEGVGIGAVDGKLGGGVYSVDYEAEGSSVKTREVLSKLEEQGVADLIWEHTQKEFLRITGSLTCE